MVLPKQLLPHEPLQLVFSAPVFMPDSALQLGGPLLDVAIREIKVLGPIIISHVMFSCT